MVITVVITASQALSLAASPGTLAPATEGGPSYARFIDLKTEVGSSCTAGVQGPWGLSQGA